MKTAKLYSTLFIFIFLLNLIPQSKGSVYVSGNLGSITKIQGETKSNGLFGAALGINFPILLKAEVFYKNYTGHLLGAALRLSPLPLISLNAGAYRKLQEDKRLSDVNGIFLGPGINFNWLPVFDVFGDLSYHRIGSTNFMSAELGLRIHF